MATSPNQEVCEDTQEIDSHGQQSQASLVPHETHLHVRSRSEVPRNYDQAMELDAANENNL